MFTGCPCAVQPLGCCLHSELSHPGQVLADRGEVRERRAGDRAVAVADDGDVLGDVKTCSKEGNEDAVGAAVVSGEPVQDVQATIAAAEAG
jgi:hypothetical protein